VIVLWTLWGCPAPTDSAVAESAPCEPASGRICPWAGTGQAGFYGDDGDRLDAWLYHPLDVEFSPWGKTVIQDWNNHRIRSVDEDGTIRTVMGTDFVGDGDPELADRAVPGAPGTTVKLNHPTDAVYGPDGTLYSASWHTHKLRTLDPTTGMVVVHCGSTPGFAGVDDAPASTALLNQPKAIEIDPSDGTLYFVDMRNELIRVITPALTIHTLAGTQATKGFAGDGDVASLAQFAFPSGTNPRPGGSLALDGRQLYVADTENHRVRVIDLDTTIITTVVGSGTAGYAGDGGPAIDAQLNYPVDIEVVDGTMYIADTDNNVIRAVDLGTMTIDTVVGTGAGAGTEDNYDSGDGGPAREAELNHPHGVEVDEEGNLYVADSRNHRIRVVSP
jgi:DNA-binding beta-propeller fold protein YncE